MNMNKFSFYKCASVFSAGMLFILLQESIGEVSVPDIFKLSDALMVSCFLIIIMGYMVGKEK